MSSAKKSNFSEKQYEMNLLIHRKRLSEIQQRKQEQQPKNYLFIQSFKKNQLIFQRQNELRKWENIFQQNESFLTKLNQVTSSFKRSNSRQSIKSKQSCQSNRSLNNKEANEQRIRDNQRMKKRINEIQSTFRSVGNNSQKHLKPKILKINYTQIEKQSPPTKKSLQIQGINQIKLLSFPTVRQNNIKKIVTQQQKQLVQYGLPKLSQNQQQKQKSFRNQTIPKINIERGKYQIQLNKSIN